MEKKEMLEVLISHFCGGNKAQFAAAVGITPQALSMWFTRKSFDSEAIYRAFEDVSGDWLLSGEGEMLKSVSLSVKESEELKRLKQEVKSLRDGQKTTTRIVVELDVSNDEFVRMGLKDKVIQILRSIGFDNRKQNK